MMGQRRAVATNARAIGAIAVIGSALGLGLLYWWQKPKPATDLIKESNVEADAFAILRKRDLIPIISSRNQAVGSVFTVNGARWLYRPSDCFANLPTPDEAPSTLPAIKLSDIGAIGFGLGLNQPLDGKLASSTTANIELQFSDVRVSFLPENDLRQHYKSSACPEIKDLMTSLNSGTPASNAATNVIVIGEVYWAKRQVMISFESTAKLQETIAWLRSTLGVKAKFESQANSSYVIRIDDQVPLPAAARAAFIPVPAGGVLGGGNANTDIYWEPFDPELKPSQRQRFDQLYGDAMAKAYESNAAAPHP